MKKKYRNEKGLSPIVVQKLIHKYHKDAYDYLVENKILSKFAHGVCFNKSQLFTVKLVKQKLMNKSDSFINEMLHWVGTKEGHIFWAEHNQAFYNKQFNKINLKLSK